VINRLPEAMWAADLALAQRCASGDRPAQRQLFQAQKQRVHVILFRILGTNRDLEDVLQDAFVEIFRSLGRFRGEASLGTWIDRITARTAFRYLSSRTPDAVRLEVISQYEPGQGPDLEDELYLRDVARRLYTVLDRLEPKYRIAYALHVVDERSLAEVAAMTEVSLFAAKNRVWRARQMVNDRAKSDPVLREFLQRQARRNT
jgi:RNA polymerase sigma-70 factor (ECF subfamily)